MALRAIDLYSGIGGWSIALSAAEIEVVASYDLWKSANVVHGLNHYHSIATIDIRKLELNDLPKDIDIVVGSPPCTQFSYSNRGGSGNLSDGLAHVQKFLEIVEHLQPRYWAMENVPRVGGILDRELQKGGKLFRFRNLNGNIAIVDASELGLPQRRRRCIFGSIDRELLNSYKQSSRQTSLGEVIQALKSPKVSDPNFELVLDSLKVTDRQAPTPLSEEETRINFASKTLHPVYNRMAFPDSLQQPSRTVTATCTNVSRESIVIPVNDDATKVRRLSVRERATLQGFPINYTFGNFTEPQKARMIGNAIPPLLAHAVVSTMLSKSELKPLIWNSRTVQIEIDQAFNQGSRPQKPVPAIPATRAFRFSIPTLHMGSGVRFELANNFSKSRLDWGVRYVYGTPKSIRSMYPTKSFLDVAKAMLEEIDAEAILECVSVIGRGLARVSGKSLQARWSRRSTIGPHPFELLDQIDESSSLLLTTLSTTGVDACALLAALVERNTNVVSSDILAFRKAQANADKIFAGLLIAAIVNLTLVEPTLDDYPITFNNPRR